MPLKHPHETLEDRDFYVVVHPLQDEPETKLEISHLGPIRITRKVRWSLMILRGYLITMLAMLTYHVIDLAGVFHK